MRDSSSSSAKSWIEMLALSAEAIKGCCGVMGLHVVCERNVIRGAMMLRCRILGDDCYIFNMVVYCVSTREGRGRGGRMFYRAVSCRHCQATES